MKMCTSHKKQQNILKYLYSHHTFGVLYSASHRVPYYEMSLSK